MEASNQNTTAIPAPAPAVPPASRPAPQRKPDRGHCRYYNTKNGCRAGDFCPFEHDHVRSKASTGSQAPGRTAQTITSEAQFVRDVGQLNLSNNADEGTSTPAQEHRQYAPPPVDRTRVVPKPVSRSQASNPRDFQIQQLKRRFSPSEASEDEGTSFTFSMIPSDPDFPFEMAGLECVLHVPARYPSNGKPSLDVKNRDMGRGYQINVERGFDDLVQKMPGSTLLALMNALDRKLESLLTEQKAETIKIIPNGKGGSFPTQDCTETKVPASKSDKVLVDGLKAQFTPEQKRTAQGKREVEIRQLEARLGRLPLFSKSSDGITYTVPIEPRRFQDLPVPLQAVRSVKLFVPLLYPLQHCSIEIMEVPKDAAEPTEIGFERKARGSLEMSLIGHINYLAQHMHELATKPFERPDTIQKEVAAASSANPDHHKETPSVIVTAGQDYRSHIKVIPRPPEWSMINEDGEDDSDLSDSSDAEYDYVTDEEEAEGEGDGVPLPRQDEATGSAPERGILLSFPSLELYSVELLELTSLSLTIKCNRCKDTMDIPNLHNAVPHNTSCKKCASPLIVTYRRELMHTNSHRAGHIDLEGCTPVDLLTSTFIPTCSSCSTPYTHPGVTAVRADSSLAICRSCHTRLSFKIPSVKFLLISRHSTHHLAPTRKRPKENLGIVTGTELLSRGRCTHYGKSYRWFRFSCCDKVFPCDKCHDKVSEHANEHAERMICGWCSREQNYRPEECGICRGVLVGRKGNGFWEGGKGTRDKARMSRKDPRKWKRRGTKKVG